MSAVREAWTDERLDDLSKRMDRGFERVDTDIRELRSEMNTRFDSMDSGFNARLDAMQRTMLTMMASMIVGFVAVLGSVIATQL